MAVPYIPIQLAQLNVQHHIAQQHQRLGAHLLCKALLLVRVQGNGQQFARADFGPCPFGAVLQQNGAQHSQQSQSNVGRRLVQKR